MTKTERTTNAEFITLPVGIPGVGRAGDRVVSDPDAPNGRTLVAVRYLDPGLLSAIRERVAGHSENAAQEKGVTK